MKKIGEKELPSLKNEHQFAFTHCATLKMKGTC